jgi:subtilase family serine protease
MPARSPGVQQLAGHITPTMARARLVGRSVSTNPLTLIIGLPVRDNDALARAVTEVSDPTSPSYRQYLTPTEFADRHGATPADYQKVVDWARARNFEVTPHDGRLVVQVTGAVSDIESAFHLNIGTGLRPDGSRFFGPDREPSLDLAVPIEHIHGLDNFELPRPAADGSAPNTGFWGNDFRHAYASCTSNTGTGQSVGLLAIGDGARATDISTFITLTGLQGVPAVLTIGPAGSGGDVEDTLDVEMAMSMAPGAQVVAFRGSVNQSLTAMTQHPEVKQISSSYAIGLDQTGRNLIAQLAMQGQSFFQASGDNGAYNAAALGGTADPREQPAVTVVGGTNLSMIAPGVLYTGETGWSGSGGGIIDNTTSSNGVGIPIPSYQVGFANASNQASTTFRNLPDVSMPATSLAMVLDGVVQGVGGTSASAPLWAGFMALINQQGMSNNTGSVGFANPALYLVAKSAFYANTFHDPTVGSNPSTTPGTPVTFNATTGYDLVTGLGSPACDLIGTLGNPRTSAAAPGSTVFGGLLHMAYISNDSTTHSLSVSRSTDGVNWGPEILVDNSPTSAAAPALVALGNTLHMFFIADDANHQLFHVTSTDGMNWSAKTPVGAHASKAAPAAIVFGNAIHLAYIANNSSNTLLHVSSTDGVNWGTETSVGGHASKAGPAMAILPNFLGISTLHMLYVANDSTNGLRHVSSTNGTSWTSETQVGHSSKAAPALAVLNNTMHMTYISNTSANTLLHVSSTNGTSWSSETQTGGHSSKSSPTLANFKGALRMSYLSNNSANMLLRISSPNGISWGPETVW